MCVEKKSTSSGLMTNDGGGFNPEVVCTEFIEYLFLDVMDTYACGETTFRSNPPVEVFYFWEVMLKVRRCVDDMGWVTHTVHWIIFHIRKDSGELVYFSNETEKLT